MNVNMLTHPAASLTLGVDPPPLGEGERSDECY